MYVRFKSKTSLCKQGLSIGVLIFKCPHEQVPLHAIHCVYIMNLITKCVV